MHWAQKIAIAKEAREGGRYMRDDSSRLGQRLNEEAARTWEGTLDLTKWSPFCQPLTFKPDWQWRPENEYWENPVDWGNVWASDRTG